MKAMALEFRKMPVLCVCRSEKELKVLVENSKKASQGKEFVLLLNYDMKLIPRILPAFINARIRMHDGIARSKSVQIEMLLLVCGSMKIEKALKTCGASDARKFLLFATDNTHLSAFAKRSRITITERLDLPLDSRIAGNVAMTELLSE